MVLSNSPLIQQAQGMILRSRSSGYLSPKLQLKYGVGIFNSLGEFTLRYELMKNLYLEAVQGLDSAVDVLYKFEFD